MNTNYNLLDEQNVSDKEGLKLIIKHFKPFTFSLIIIILLLLGVNILGSYVLPRIGQFAIDNFVVNKDLVGLKNLGIIGAVLISFNIILNYFRVRTTGELAQKILFNIREEVFIKIQNLPSKFTTDNQSGELIQRLTGNVEGVNQFFSEGLVRILNITFIISTTLVAMFLHNWKVALISLISGLIVLIFIIIQTKLLEKKIRISLERESLISARTQESLDNFIAIKSLNQENSWSKDFSKLTQSYYKVAKKVSAISSTSESFLSMMGFIALILTVLYSLHLFSQNLMTIGTIVIFVAYTQNLFRSLGNISRISQNIKTGISSAARLNVILNLDNDIVSKENSYKPDNIKGDIEFVDVDFGYNGDGLVLSDVNFKAEKGKTIAIIGPTGAGKTTFVNLIARLYDVNNGEILIDGVNVKDWDLDTLRKRVGYLIQDTFLFEDTILNNLKYDNPKITKDDAYEMFRKLGALPFINSLPKGLDTKISTQSDRISSGQRQIIALARILLREPKILILDEATARIDTKSEKMLQSAIEKAVKGKTTFVIAHRLSTIFNADQIVLLNESTILEKGTHQELLDKKGFYYEIYSKFVGM
jgi:ABC-type multidrug transport system fused ATPase/permease subunit